jgi:hypothetical protein
VGGALVALSLLGALAATLMRQPASPIDATRTVESRTNPVFRQSSEEQRFIQAVTQGKEGAIAALQRALAQAREGGDADPGYVADLERQLAARKQELAATVGRHR